ncbi:MULTISPECIES: SOS response-associated peptidase [unclassified Brevibacterium]|uniref:SOS response-associated peptidase n=1 Tax=unclassified Brevibacterium TaxID=2614124 RepID=UPI001E3526EC|nr:MULTISPECIES: SOS response-associated peptidase [unclassified Brevibacterium]MCD1286919.1 SOS response-associated peptidase [Brevibacterium sp. CCUG 69071]MDK8436146.1 SOS response-associated peptidase [Brevibacterium sp. H-BE7]
MCGRLNMSLDPADLADELRLDVVSYDFTPRYNVPPGSFVPIVVERLDEDGQLNRRLETASWGLVPAWAKDTKIGFKAFNARSETVLEKPMFRQAIKRRRCALPIPGYYEWEVTDDGKQPWMMTSAGDGPLFMAGLFEFWKQPDQSWLVSTTIMTMESAGHLQGVHHRMPVFLSREHIDEWIDPATASSEVPALLDSVLGQVDPAGVDRHKVGKEIGNVRNDRPELARPVA